MPFSAPAKYPGAVAGAGDLLNLKDEVGSPTLPTLAASILSTDTSFSIAAGTGVLLPTDNFLITVESEIMFVGSRATDTLSSVTRGAQSTVAVGHAAGTAVNQFYNAIHHNQLASEVNAIETLVGAAPAAHGVLLAEGASPLISLVPGASGTILVSNGATVDPSWQGAVSNGGLVGASAASVAVTSVATFFMPYSGGGLSSTTESNVDMTAPDAATVKNLYVDVSQAPGTGNTFVVTLRKNGVDTALTATISGTGTAANDTTHSVSVAAGDLLTWKLAGTGTITVTPNFSISSEWSGSAAGGSAAPWTDIVPATIVPPALLQFTATHVPAGDSAAQVGNVVLVEISTSNASADIATWLKNAPATPYTAVMGFVWLTQFGTYPHFGFALEESSTGKYVVFTVQWTNNNYPPQPTVAYWSSVTTFSSAPYNTNWGFAWPVTWMAVKDDGTNLYFYILPDGRTLVQLYSASRTAFLASGPDKIGFTVRNGTGGVYTLSTIVHWSGA